MRELGCDADDSMLVDNEFAEGLYTPAEESEGDAETIVVQMKVNKPRNRGYTPVSPVS